MASMIKTNVGRIFFSLSLLTVLISVVSAQTTMPAAPKVSAVPAPPSVPVVPSVTAMPSKSSMPATPAIPAAPAMPAMPTSKSVPAASAISPIKTPPPTTAGRWVPRTNKTTCPNGSVAYVDDVNGGVKCWVNDA